jgi:branched-chain amino acid transport system ATP-binding protein
VSILEVKGVSKYFGGLAALNNIDLTIQEGEIRGIIGPNGAGKTTLFNVISGVYRPDTGQIFYMDSKRIDGLATSKIAEMGLVRTFQRTALYHDFTVLKNVMPRKISLVCLPARLRKWKRSILKRLRN